MVKAAKKRKKEEDEEFRFPEFDEQDYLRKEVELSKSTFVTIGLAIPVAVLLYGLTLVQVPIVAFFVGMAATFALPRIYRLLPWPKLDLARFERKDWVGQGGTFFLAWLTIWILLLNVPFTDVTPPVIAGVTVANGKETVRMANDAIQQQDIPNNNGTPLWVNATIFENSNDIRVTFTVDGTDANWTRVANQPIYYVRVSGQSAYAIAITATDRAGLTTRFEFKVTVT